MILAIDPGPEQSAVIHLDDRQNVVTPGILPTAETLAYLKRYADHGTVVIEMIASYGMPVGAEVFKTCVNIGRFIEHCGCLVHLLPRIQVKSAICHSGKATDANIRQALLDRFGGKERAMGNKKSPGPLYGVKADLWAALAVACAYQDGARGAWAEGKEPQA